MGKVVKKINALADDIKALDDAQLAAKTDEFRQRLADGETLDELAARGLCGGARGGRESARSAAF